MDYHPPTVDMKIVTVDIFLYKYKKDFAKRGLQKKGALIDDEQGNGV